MSNKRDVNSKEFQYVLIVERKLPMALCNARWMSKITGSHMLQEFVIFVNCVDNFVICFKYERCFVHDVLYRLNDYQCGFDDYQ